MSRRGCSRILAVAFVAAWVIAPPGGLQARPAAGAPQPVDSGALRPIEDWLQVVVDADPRYHYDAVHPLDSLTGATRLAFYGMQPVLSDTLQHQFLGLSNEPSRREWMRRYWALRDPTPTTTPNERWQEHVRRVAYARSHFGIPKPPYWDARGAFFVQYGAPATVDRDLADSRIGVGYVAKRETWIYTETRLVATFAQPTPSAPWVLGTAGAKQTNRRDLQADATDPYHAHNLEDPDLPSLAELAPDARHPDLEAWAPSGQEVVAAAIAESHLDHFTLPGGPRRFLPYAFDTDVFRGAPRRPRLEAHVQFDRRALAFERDAKGWMARFGVEGVLLDDSVRVVAHAGYRDSLRVETLDATKEPMLWPGQLDFDVAPGAYRLALRVFDPRTRSEGNYSADLRVPSLDAPSLLVSDLEFATHVIDTLGMGPFNRFTKHDRVVLPNPVATYRPGEQLTGYFEIYGLQLDDQHRGRYQVTYSFAPRGTVRAEGWFPSDQAQTKPSVSSSFEGTAPDATVREFLFFDVKALAPDTYDLVLTVRDLQAGSEATSRACFRMLR